ncbi:portal protein [Agrobacterium rosae]|uniref:portal protein n=1 Tax=Agrobacterium rosae TaxID=1972867 RepID=UPI003B9E3B73
MAKEPKKKSVDESKLTNQIARMVRDAVGFSATNIENKMEQALSLYKREALDGDDKFSGRSKWVSPDVMERVDWSVAQCIRVFDSSNKVVEFLPNGPEDEPLAEQQTMAVNFIARSKNSHVAFLEPWLKNGFITGLGITMVDFKSYSEEGMIETLKGVADEQLVQITQDEADGNNIIEKVGEPYSAPLPPELQGLIQQQRLPPEAMEMAAQFVPQVRDLQIRKIRKQRQMVIKNLRPEDFIVSKDASFDQQTGGICAKVQGHKRVVGRASLIEQGFDKEKVEKIVGAHDRHEGISLVRSERTDYDEGVSDVEDDVTVYEIFTFIAIDSDKRRHYRITLAGDIESSPVLLDYTETSKYYPYAAFCPFPMPNTLFGHGIADRIGDDQILLSKMQRGVIDSLHKSVHPTQVINPDVTNVDDALNIHPGSIIRSSDPTGGITYNTVPFTGASALPIMDQIRQSIDFTTGVGGGMMAVNASDLQNTTATATSQRANSAQLLIELICRHFADTGYRYLFKIIVDLLVQFPEDAEAFIKRLTDQYERIKVDEWDPDMDVTATIAFGVMNKDFNAAMLQNILGQQMQLLQSGMPIVQPQNIYNTLTKMAENAGFKNAGAFWVDPSTLPPPPPPAPPVDPNAGLIEIEKVKAQLKAESDQQKAQIDLLKLRIEDDRKRDEMIQSFSLKFAELEAKYSAQLDIAKIQMAQAEQRNDVDLAIAAQAEQQSAMAEQAQRQQEEQAQLQALQQQEQMRVQQEQAALAQQMPPQFPPQGV